MAPPPIWRYLTTQHKREYNMWNNMHARCYDKTQKDYHNYGGKDIKVCPRWHDFDNFCDDVMPVPDGMTLGRRDHTKDYSPDNWHWQTPAQQAQDREYNCNIEWNGKRQPASMWAKELNMGYRTILSRAAKGYPPEIILFQDPLRSRAGHTLLRKYGYDPETLYG